MQHGWTLEKRKWDNLLSVVTGTRWSKTQLVSLERDSVPQNRGVYAICVTLKTLNFNQNPFKTLYEIIYVGKSNCLRRRFLEHCDRAKRGVQMAKGCFGNNLEYWFTIVDANRIDELETRLIECFGPPANLKDRHIPARIGSSKPA